MTCQYEVEGQTVATVTEERKYHDYYRVVLYQGDWTLADLTFETLEEAEAVANEHWFNS